MNTRVRIARGGSHRTVSFAARELAKHLGKALGTQIPVGALSALDERGPTLKVGLCAEFGIRPPAGLGPEDDWVCIRPEGPGYILTGVNPRSVLFAVYRYLHELGFRWIRPGRRGAIVPKLRSPLARGLRVAETPSYPYRTICIEGACSEQHVVDLVDWMAKQGMNGYFIQFENGTYFWRNWYLHEGNPYLDAEPFGPERVAKIVARVIRELGKRGMRFERMGHGWTCAPLGIEGEGWDVTKAKLTAPQRKMLAEVAGKREFWHGVPLNTNLCYSNPTVHDRMAASIAEYAGAHPEVDALHVWLADGMNNNCECDECSKARPSDFYVMLLNEIDEKLGTAGLGTKIVFLIYVDLLWPPQRERIRNQERFVLMFAPITRSYLQSFVDGDGVTGKTRFVRNKLEMPTEVSVNIDYLRDWQKMFRGDGFDFDYHLIWTCYADPGQYGLAKVLNRDIRGLAGIGLDGLNSCQNQRMSFPHNLAMDVMARTLWDKRATFSKISRESFADAYGRNGERVETFFREMSRLLLPFYEPVHIPQRDEARIRKGLRNVARMRECCRELRPLVRRNRDAAQQAVAWSWRYLDVYLDFLDVLLPAYESYLNASDDTRRKLGVACDFLWRKERMLHPALDVFGFVKVAQWRMNEVDEARGKSG